MKIKSVDKKNIDFIVMILFKIILDFVYYYVHAKTYDYYGFKLEYSLERMLASWILYVITAYCVQHKDSTLHSIFIYLIFMLSIAPCFTYYQYNSEAKFWMLIIQSVTIICLNFMFKSSAKKNESIVFKGIPYKNDLFRVALIILLLLYLAFMFSRYGLPSLSSMSVTKISETRSEVEISTILSILQNIICKIICPVFMLIALKEKKVGLFLLTLVVQIYTYGVTGFKTFLFVPVIVVAVGIFPRINLKDCILYGLPILVLFVTILYVVIPRESTLYIYALSVERVVFLPAKIKISYFDYFSSHDYIWFAQSTIGKLFGLKSSYTQNIPNLIGEVYFNRPEMWTNTGFIADAYANGGIVGIALISVILFYFIRLSERLLFHSSESLVRLIQVVYLLFFISLNDGGAISVIFSGGMIFVTISLLIVDFSERKSSIDFRRQLVLGNAGV